VPQAPLLHREAMPLCGKYIIDFSGLAPKNRPIYGKLPSGSPVNLRKMMRLAFMEPKIVPPMMPAGMGESDQSDQFAATAE